MKKKCPYVPKALRRDASRRDFTVNSLYYNITTASIEDWTGQVSSLSLSLSLSLCLGLCVVCV
jgi:hypothetical protein